MNASRQTHEQSAGLRALDEQLRRTMPADPPAGLADRIFNATATDLPRNDAPRGVIARIGSGALRFTPLAAAAAIVVGLTIATWMATHAGPDDPGAAFAVTETEIETIALALDASAEAPTLSVELHSLQSELDDLASVLADGNGQTSSLIDELDNLETGLRQF